MLDELVIDNLGVIAQADIRFGPGLSVITGETGAGKTMLLNGLSLICGGKADAAAIRVGADTAAAEGRWMVADRPDLVARVEDAGGQLDDDGSLVVLRTVSAGRSRAHLGGRSVPAAVLADIADDLITVHGQADQLRLRTANKQRDALDTFAGPAHAASLDNYRKAWTDRAAVQADLADLDARASERAREADLLRARLDHIERVAPQPGEDADLQALTSRLGNIEALRVAATTAHQALAGESDDVAASAPAVALVETARREIAAAAHDDPALADLSTRLTDAGYAIADIGSELAAYVDGLSADPAALEAAHARLAQLTALTRTSGETIDDVLAWASDAGLRLLDLDDTGDRRASLVSRIAALDASVAQWGAAVTQGRITAARDLAAAVTAELAGLAMTGASMQVAVEPVEPGPSGADAVAFTLVAHPGAPARPLGKGASGGELSRIMLAIEVALAQRATNPTVTRQKPGAAETIGSAGLLPTFVFDEVDAGVGGQAAVEVGRRLAQLAHTTQVIVVTHLAQVAAFADTHLVVAKRTDATHTVTAVSQVTGQQRVTELARMLSGQNDSTAAPTHAAELLETSKV